MTEQPVETEQQFLGNETTRPQSRVESEFLSGVGEKYADMIQPRQSYVPNAHRYRFQMPELTPPPAPAPARETNLELEAEVHAGHAVRSLEDGELDAGIAWLQSALAFAQNARHSRETAPKETHIYSFDVEAARP